MWTLVLEPDGSSGEQNMALDNALLDEVVQSGGAFLRLYRWDPPTLSVGRNQALDGFDKRDFAIVRRPTGGQAVWHEHEVTYAVTAPIAMFGSLRKAYCEIHTRLVRALRLLGIDAGLATARPPVRPSARQTSCFADPVGGEILVDGRKLVGSAQVRRGNAFLQHGSILLAGSQSNVSQVTKEATLSTLLGRAVDFDEVSAAIIHTWGEPLRPSGRQPVRPSEVASLAAQ